MSFEYTFQSGDIKGDYSIALDIWNLSCDQLKVGLITRNGDKIYCLNRAILSFENLKDICKVMELIRKQQCAD